MATYTDLSDIRCSSASVTPNGNNSVTVSLDDASVTDVFDQVDISEAVSHYGIKEFLDAIGEKEAADHFDLVERPA